MVWSILHDHLWHLNRPCIKNFSFFWGLGWLSCNTLVAHGAHYLVSALISVHSLVGGVGVGVSEAEIHCGQTTRGRLPPRYPVAGIPIKKQAGEKTYKSSWKENKKKEEEEIKGRKGVNVCIINEKSGLCVPLGQSKSM